MMFYVPQAYTLHIIIHTTQQLNCNYTVNNDLNNHKNSFTYISFLRIDLSRMKAVFLFPNIELTK